MSDNKNNQEQIRHLLSQDFELKGADEGISEKQLFDLLCDQVAYMIEYKLDVLLSLMYRLDIDESKVHFALSPMSVEPPNVGIAQLVWERQKQRVFTKNYYKPPSLDNLGDLEY